MNTFVVSQFELRARSRNPRATSAADRTTKPCGGAGTIFLAGIFSRLLPLAISTPELAAEGFRAAAWLASLARPLSLRFLRHNNCRPRLGFTRLVSPQLVKIGAQELLQFGLNFGKAAPPLADAPDHSDKLGAGPFALLLPPGWHSYSCKNPCKLRFVSRS